MKEIYCLIKNNPTSWDYSPFHVPSRHWVVTSDILRALGKCGADGVFPTHTVYFLLGKRVCFRAVTGLGMYQLSMCPPHYYRMAWHRAWTQPNHSPTLKLSCWRPWSEFSSFFFQIAVTVSSMGLEPLVGGGQENKWNKGRVCLRVRACIHVFVFKYVCDTRRCLCTCVYICEHICNEKECVCMYTRVQAYVLERACVYAYMCMQPCMW